VSNFDNSKFTTVDKLRNFPKYVRRQDTARFLARYEIFKRQLNIKGSIIECGVHQGGGLLGWAHYTAALEPYNYHQEIIGFDTFEGFPEVTDEDGASKNARVGAFSERIQIDVELEASIEEFNSNRFLSNKEKIKLIKGDANVTIPQYIKSNPHLIVSLLYLDFDIYKPTVTAIKNFLPRMPKGSVIAFDEVNNADWPGETTALLENLNLNNYRLECIEYEPEIAFIQL